MRTGDVLAARQDSNDIGNHIGIYSGKHIGKCAAI